MCSSHIDESNQTVTDKKMENGFKTGRKEANSFIDTAETKNKQK